VASFIACLQKEESVVITQIKIICWWKTLSIRETDNSSTVCTKVLESSSVIFCQMSGWMTSTRLPPWRFLLSEHDVTRRQLSWQTFAGSWRVQSGNSSPRCSVTQSRGLRTHHPFALVISRSLCHVFEWMMRMFLPVTLRDRGLLLHPHWRGRSRGQLRVMPDQVEPVFAGAPVCVWWIKCLIE